MGLFSFVQDAGKKLFGGDEQKAVTSAADQVAKLEAARRQAIHRKFHDELASHGLDVAGLEIELIGGGVVKASGKVKDQETKEKILLALGNVAGVSSVEDHLAVPAGAVESVFYTVKKGDTLSKIAKEQYGNANAYMKIFEANKPMLTHPDKIYPGQSLRIPPK